MMVMDYSEMINNANLVKDLANKTIECSKDYTDSRSDDIIEQMMVYLEKTVEDVFASNYDRSAGFREKANRGSCISFGSFLNDGRPQRLQFWYNSAGTKIQVLFNEFGHWYITKDITNAGLTGLINSWDRIKHSWEDAITSGIKCINATKINELDEQLKLHEAIKNFKI